MTAYVVGTARLRLSVFVLFAFPGGALWVGTFLVVGYVLGQEWRYLSEEIHRHAVFSSVFVLALSGVIWLFRSRRRSPDDDESCS